MWVFAFRPFGDGQTEGQMRGCRRGRQSASGGTRGAEVPARHPGDSGGSRDQPTPPHPAREAQWPASERPGRRRSSGTRFPAPRQDGRLACGAQRLLELLGLGGPASCPSWALRNDPSPQDTRAKASVGPCHAAERDQKVPDTQPGKQAGTPAPQGPWRLTRPRPC